MDRRLFLKQLTSGIAIAAAVRAWPFRVYSFPTDIKPWHPYDWDGTRRLNAFLKVHPDGSGWRILLQDLRIGDKFRMPLSTDPYVPGNAVFTVDELAHRLSPEEEAEDGDGSKWGFHFDNPYLNPYLSQDA
jgi:hypothetical protein